MAKLKPGDMLINSELSRLGRSTSEVIDIVNELINKKISFVAIKQNIKINGAFILIPPLCLIVQLPLPL